MSEHTEQPRGVRNFPLCPTKNSKKRESRRCLPCAMRFCNTWTREKNLAVINRRSVVSVSRLCPVVGVIGLNFDMPERSVFIRIGGRVADRILISQLFLDLVEDFVQRMF